MGSYTVSARKYRPTTFDSVVGQQALTTTLKNAIISEKLASSYLFCGPRGVQRRQKAVQVELEVCGHLEEVHIFFYLKLFHNAF